MSSSKTGPGEMLTCAEAAKYLGCSVRTVHRMVSRGEIPIVRLSRRLIRIPRAALDGLAALAKPKTPPKRDTG